MHNIYNLLLLTYQ